MESNLSNAPFFIGQEVVALMTVPHKESGGIKKGRIYIVLGLEQCTVCKTWYVCFSECAYTNVINSCCSVLSPVNNYWKISAKNFAPVSRLRISDELTIAADLFQTKPVEERADVLIPETIEK